MIQFSKREDQIMQIVWRLENAFIRDIVEAFPAPKPHYNTVATIVKILVKKGALQSKILGNTHQYTSAIDFNEYREEQVDNIKQKFFDNSFPKMFAHFAKKEKLSKKEMEEILDIINSKTEDS